MVVLHLGHDLAAASDAIDRALSLNSSSATALYLGAHIHGWSGNPALAEDFANRALRLSPFDPLGFHAHLALGNVRIRERRYDDAAVYCARAVHANPRFSSIYAYHAAPLAMAGRIEEAKLVAQRLLELEPTFRTEPLLKYLATFARPEIVDGLAVGLRRAGLPE